MDINFIKREVKSSSLVSLVFIFFLALNIFLVSLAASLTNGGFSTAFFKLKVRLPGREKEEVGRA